MPSVEYMDGIKETKEFMDSPRGQVLIAQALYLAIQRLSEVPEPHREMDNIMDMSYLLHVMFPHMEQLFDKIYVNEWASLPPQGLR